VTHLPQLAAFGDQHLNVQKTVADGRTVTTVEVLDGSRRLDELALMLGGLNDANRSAAEVTLSQARQRSSMLG
jgi:DNA repair protein RecN (Recombination protein N)